MSGIILGGDVGVKGSHNLWEGVGNTKTTERGGESVVYKLKQFYTF
jgi:hypothetical protein